MRFQFALPLLSLAVGCGGVHAGDYQIYRIGFADTVASDDCFVGGPSIDDAEDTTTFRTGDTFALYAGTEGALFLEYGSDVLEGTQADGAYSFSGQAVDVEYAGTNNENVTTNTQTLTVTMDPAGASVTGDAVSDVNQLCTGPGCSAVETFHCSGTSAFIGTRVNDVELEHTL